MKIIIEINDICRAIVVLPMPHFRKTQFKDIYYI